MPCMILILGEQEGSYMLNWTAMSHQKGKRLGGMPISFYSTKTIRWDPLGVRYYLILVTTSCDAQE